MRVAERMRDGLGGSSGGSCFSYGVEVPQVTLAASDDNHGAPFLSISHPSYAANTGTTVRAPRLNVLVVLRGRRFSQIGEPVIRAHRVAVIKPFGGPVPSHIKPRETVGRALFPIDPNENVSTAARHAASDGPCGNAPAPPGIGAPSKHPRLPVVVQQFAQAISGKRGWFCHAPILVARARGLKCEADYESLTLKPSPP